MFKEKNENEEREKFSREKLGFRKFLCFSTAWLLFRQKYFKGVVVVQTPHNKHIRVV